MVFLSESFNIDIFILACRAEAFAQGKNFSINRHTPSWLSILTVKTPDQKTKTFLTDILYHYTENQNHAELQEEYTHLVREIVSDAGVQNGSQISVTYDLSFQKLVFHKILLWRNNKVFGPDESR